MDQIAVDRTGPKAFILAPDGEFSAFDPENDQIWELSLDPSESCPFHLHTTYQLRARSMRVFPNILIGGHRLKKPTDFSLPPTVISYMPGALKIKYCFSKPLQVQFDVFIPEQDVLVGTLAVMNTSSEPISIHLEMAAVLIPMEQGHPTHPEVIHGNHILTGQTEDLYPVLFMSGGPSGTNNPHPTLRIPLVLEPGQPSEVQWVLASKGSQAASVKAGRHWIAHNWYKDLQVRKKTHEKNMVFIKTGLPDWDSAFYLAQVKALTHLVSLNPKDPHPTFIRARLTDEPKRSLTGPDRQTDLTLLDALHLAQVVLPPQGEHFTRLAEGFLARVNDQGLLPPLNHRGTSGGAINECPLLAQLCLMLYDHNRDLAFLQRAYPSLRRFFDTGWYKNASYDQNSLPPWDTPEQLQLHSGLFNFDIWEETGNGLDIRTAQSPAMAAMLYREALALQKIADLLDDRPARNLYARWIKTLQGKMHALWNDTHQNYCYQDIDTHQTPARELYYPGRIQATRPITKQFTVPQRLQVLLTTPNGHPQEPSVRLEGKNAAGELITAVIQAADLRWIAGRAHYTTPQVFSSLDAVHFEGFNTKDHFLIKTADYSQTDITCLLPVWSGGIHKDHLAAVLESLQKLIPGFEAGIPETWRCSQPLPEDLPTPINIQWNSLIIDGLAREGFSTEAMALFTSLMSVILQGLTNFNGFYPTFDHHTSLPLGAANAITGLAPVGLFLKIAGIKIFSPNRVALWGQNPFPWPIEIRWQGLWVHKEGAHTQIIFPDGTSYHSQSGRPRVIKSGKG